MEKVQITGVPETMIQTLFARASFSKEFEPSVTDVVNVWSNLASNL